MPAPRRPTIVSYTQIDYSTQAGGGSGGTKTSASISWQAGDVIVVLSGVINCAPVYTTPSGTGLTFTNRQLHHTHDGTQCATGIWTAQPTASGSSAITVDINLETIEFGASIWVVRGSSGIGNSAMQLTATKTVSLTPQRANSLILWATYDWNAEAVHTITPTPDNTRIATQYASKYTVHVSDLIQTSAGAVSYGISGGSSTGPYSIVVFEALALLITPVFCCGFECGVDTTVSGHVRAAAGSPSYSTTTTHSGARSGRCNPSAAAGIAFVASPFTTQTRVIGRFYVYFATLPTADSYLCGLDNVAAGNEQTGPCVRFKQSDSKIYAAIGTTLGASGVAVTTGHWYLIDHDFNISTGGNDLCDVRVDGTACGQATAAGQAIAQSNIQWGVNGSGTRTADAFFDDLIVSNTAADYPIGAGYVHAFVPTADGAHNVAGANDFERSLTGTDITNATTDAYLLVNTLPLQSGTPTSFVNLIAPANITDYVEVIFGPAPGSNAPMIGPRAVDVLVASAAQSTTTNNLQLSVNDNGTIDAVRNATVGSTTVIFNRKHYADPPSAATYWDVVSGNGNFRNLRMRCLTSDAAPDPYFVGAIVEAEFEDVVRPKVLQVNQSVNRASTY